MLHILNTTPVFYFVIPPSVSPIVIFIMNHQVPTLDSAGSNENIWRLGPFTSRGRWAGSSGPLLCAAEKQSWGQRELRTGRERTGKVEGTGMRGGERV
jgi:hypothetical protein